MQSIMLVDEDHLKSADFQRPMEVLKNVYRNFGFSTGEMKGKTCSVHAVVDVQGREKGGAVEQNDLRASFDPILHHVKIILRELSIEFQNIDLESVRKENDRIIFKFVIS